MPTRKKTEMDYFAEGQEAYRINKPKEANPYEWNPHLRGVPWYWDQGWESEEKAAYGETR